MLWIGRWLTNENCPNHVIRLSGIGAIGEVAAILRYDSTAMDSTDPRNLIVSVGQNNKVQIPTISRLWEPLAYPLLFDKGTLGWGVVNDLHNLNMPEYVNESEIQSTQMWYYRIMLLREERFSLFGRLGNEYLVDMWTRELETRLHYYRMNEERRMEQDAELMGAENSEVFPRENVYLPANFTGSLKWASEHVGAPSFRFIRINSK